MRQTKSYGVYQASTQFSFDEKKDQMEANILHIIGYTFKG